MQRPQTVDTGREILESDTHGDPLSQMADEEQIVADQDETNVSLEAKPATAGELEFGEDEDSYMGAADPTQDLMGASVGARASVGVEEEFLQGGIDVKEEMDRAAKRMDKATGKNNAASDPTPSL